MADDLALRRADGEQHNAGARLLDEPRDLVLRLVAVADAHRGG